MKKPRYKVFLRVGVIVTSDDPDEAKSIAKERVKRKLKTDSVTTLQADPVSLAELKRV